VNLNPKIPIPLRIVAWLFILEGAVSVLGILFSLFHKSVNLDIIGVISIYAGLGILRLSNGWRWYALILLGIEILFLIVALSLITQHAWREQWTVFGAYPIWFSLKQRITVLALFQTISLFKFIVLVAPITRARFIFKPNSA